MLFNIVCEQMHGRGYYWIKLFFHIFINIDLHCTYIIHSQDLGKPSDTLKTWSSALSVLRYLVLNKEPEV